MRRRNFLTAAGGAVTASVAGCSGIGSTDDEQTLVVGTYGSFIDAPSSSPGAWLKSRFEEEFDARLVWQTPNNEVNYYIERENAGVDIEADMYLGLSTDDLVRVDEELDSSLFSESGSVDGRQDIKEGLAFDPTGRAVPFDTGYVSLVFDGTSTTAPETFDGLLDDEHAGDLITQNPSSSDTGRAVMLHPIKQYGEDGYLYYWSDLQENGVRVLGSWGNSYGAWSGGEAPMITSYSTDQVFADADGANLDEHQIRFLDGQGYASPEGMAAFESANEPELAREFMAFLLRPEIQGEIAQRNVAFPATTTAQLPDEYAELAQEPPEPVTFSYEELQGSVGGWVDDWSQQFAQN